MKEKKLYILKLLLKSLISGTFITVFLLLLTVIALSVYAFLTGNSISLPFNSIKIIGGDVGDGITGVGFMVNEGFFPSFFTLSGVLSGVLSICIFLGSLIKIKLKDRKDRP